MGEYNIVLCMIRGSKSHVTLLQGYEMNDGVSMCNNSLFHFLLSFLESLQRS